MMILEVNRSDMFQKELYLDWSLNQPTVLLYGTHFWLVAVVSFPRLPNWMGGWKLHHGYTECRWNFMYSGLRL